jgi:hypothetical protein
MKNASIPYSLIIKRYWVSLAAVSLTWLVPPSFIFINVAHRTCRFIYDFITYPFGLYSSTILDSVEPAGSSLAVIFGWNVVIKFVSIRSPIHSQLTTFK